ncbi:MAG: hypothetical protein KIS62_01260 [Ramlibacter sp.]|nr:hypothetical protein [Ramlibacter sp.]
MSQAQGALARFAYVPESTWGTTPGSPSMVKLGAAVYGEGLGGSYEELISNSISGYRDREDMRLGNLNVSGSVPFELAPLGLGTLLRYALGANVTTGSDAPYTHTMKVGALPVGLTIEKAFTDLGKYFVFTGCMVDGLTFNVTADGLVTGSIDVMGKGFTMGGTELGAPAAVAHNPFAPFEAAVTEGGGNAELLSFGMTLRNNLERVPGIGSRTPFAINPGKVDVTTTATIRFTSDAMLSKWMAETESSQGITFTTGDNSLAFEFPRIKYMGDSIPRIETDQGIVVQLNARAMRDGTAGSSAVVTLTNTEASV